MYKMTLIINDCKYSGVAKTEHKALEEAKSKCNNLHEYNWFDVKLVCSHVYENEIEVSYVTSLGGYMIATR